MTADSSNQSNTSLPVLNQIQIQTPCPMNWEEMVGDSSKRFCGSCQKHVHNFSEMGAADVDKLVNSGQSVCALIHRRADGSIVTKATPSETRITRRHWFGKLGALAASIAALITLGGCREAVEEVTGDITRQPTAEAPVLLGEIERAEMGDVAIGQTELAPLKSTELQESQVKKLGKVLGPDSK